MDMARIITFFLLGALLGWGCRPGSAPSPQQPSGEAPPWSGVVAPAFPADRAYALLDSFLQTGPRVPGTPAHRQALAFLENHLRPLATHLTIQKGAARRFDGKEVPIHNVIATFQGKSPRALLLMTHWDSRFMADQDSIRRQEPIPGADDGGSGTAVLLTLAEMFHKQQPPITIRMIFLDAEDQGAPADMPNPPPHTYCLGAQRWARSHRADQYFADYGILLDMVGGQDAHFLKEGWSEKFAPAYVNNIWALAQSLGHAPPFVPIGTDPITDDHYYIATLAGIPSIDIINYDHRRQPHPFPWYWHTHRDSLDIIDTATLDAVGEVLSTLIFTHSGFLLKP